VTEKQYGVEAAMKALSLVSEAKPWLRDSDFLQIYQLFYRTLLTARVYAATATAYFGYRVYARGEEYHSPWLRKTIQQGLDSMLAVAAEIERYPGKVPAGQWKWRNDAATAREYHKLITETGWKEYGGVVFAPSGQSEKPFQIKVVDDQTQRGVPLVELKTTNDICYVTDNNGIVAFREPGLMNQEVFFHLKSHGYEVPADGFGYRGIRVTTIPGDSVVIPIKRINIAERLYRITGAGLYHHSLEAGLPVPLKQPALNGQVTGQDTFMETLYKGRIFWVWGDTNKPSYPLGNFATSGATSELPGKRGLDPSVGIDLTYFTDETGFSKKMCPVEGPGPVWMHWLTTLKDASGKETLVGSWTRVKTLGENYEQGLAVFNDGEKVFKPVYRFELNSPFFPDGHSFKGNVAGQEYIYFDGSTRYPVRVKADLEHLKDLSAYEAFTCLKEGGRFDTAQVLIDRNENGSIRWGWKKNGEPLDYAKEKWLLQKGILKQGEGLFHLIDMESGSPVQSQSCSVFWNAYRGKWVMILEQIYGTSFLGEIWYAEGDTPVGPWVYCRKIVTHDNYSFYNVGQHPLFDQENGRLIYFEGTYTNGFTNNPVPTPRYNYNQIMYRLDLSDSALFMPEPVYRIKGKKGADRYALRKELETQALWQQVVEIPFFAFSPGRHPAGLEPVYAVQEKGKPKLSTLRPGNQALGVNPAFYALQGNPSSVTAVSGEKSLVSLVSHESPMLVPLYEFKDARGNYSYSTEENLEGYTRSEHPVCRVWKNPSSILMLDPEVLPVPAF
ncbi:MAG TPA: hypothetical protein PLW67_07170, partial [Prolixibacteraceae bacterium]|nr:hypothetical protein [Prolixibacteraceae bacterium]